MEHRRAGPDVGRLLTSYACGAVAVGLPWPLLLVLVFGEYGDGPHAALALAIAAAARMLPYLVLSWAVGALGDHVRRDRLVRATLVGRLATLTGTALAVRADQAVTAVVLAAMTVACATPAYPAVAAALPELAGPRRREATDLLVTVEAGAWVVGPALGGLLLVSALRSWTVVVALLLTAVALVTFRGARLPSPVETAPDAVRGTLRAVAGSGPVAGALGLAGLLNLVDSATGVALLPLSHQAWGQGDAGFGVATAWLGFGALGAPLLGRVCPGRGQTWRRPVGLVLVGAALALVAVSTVPWTALPLLGLAGAASVMVEGCLTGTIQDGVPDRYRAGALGVADAVMVGGALIGTLLAPAAAAALGPRVTIAGCAALCAVLVAPGLARLATRRLDPAPAPALSPAAPQSAPPGSPASAPATLAG